MNPIWTKSKWKKKELDGKSVEILWPRGRGLHISEIGKFLVSQNRDGLLFVLIEVIFAGSHWSERIQRRYYLPQAAVDRIRQHPDKSVASFLLA